MLTDDTRKALRATWITNNRVTTFLIENLTDEVWAVKVPGAPRRTVRMIAAHLHNNRCMWIRSVGTKQGVVSPAAVDRHEVSRPALVAALDGSSRGILAMIDAACAEDGRMPSAAWQNYPPEVVHFLAYHVAHEGHHRGQIVMLARQSGHRLPPAVTNGLWQWSKRAREGRA